MLATRMQMAAAGSGGASIWDNAVNYYKSDTNGSFPDAIGSNNGSISGAVYTASGKINGAYDYGAGTISISNPYSSITEWSISCWAKTTTAVLTASNSGGQPFMEPASINPHAIYLRYRNSTLSSFVNNGTTVTSVIGSTTLSAGTYYHFVVTFKIGDNARLYINGSLEDTSASTMPSGTYSSGTNITLGSVDVELDEICFWTR